MDPAATRDRKRELRARARRIEADARAPALALARLEALGVWASIGSVALYAAWRHEPPTDRLADLLAGRGVCVAWPRVEDERIVLRSCPREALAPGYRGIAEPPADAGAVPADQVDAFVVPGLLFDRRGVRLGRGHGHYDRLLSGARSDSLRIGFTLAARLVDELPVDAWDVPMHQVVTEREVVDGTGRCP
jgi:5-formyltetrahydrofolate cyclo-ligase